MKKNWRNIIPVVTWVDMWRSVIKYPERDFRELAEECFSKNSYGKDYMEDMILPYEEAKNRISRDTPKVCLSMNEIQELYQEKNSKIEQIEEEFNNRMKQSDCWPTIKKDAIKNLRKRKKLETGRVYTEYYSEILDCDLAYDLAIELSMQFNKNLDCGNESCSRNKTNDGTIRRFSLTYKPYFENIKKNKNLDVSSIVTDFLLHEELTQKDIYLDDDAELQYRINKHISIGLGYEHYKDEDDDYNVVISVYKDGIIQDINDGLFDRTGYRCNPNKEDIIESIKEVLVME